MQAEGPGLHWTLTLLPFPFRGKVDVKDGQCDSSFLCTLCGQGMREKCSDLETGNEIGRQEGGAGLSWVQLRVEAALVPLLLVPLHSPFRGQESAFFVGPVPQRQPELVGSGVQPSML